MKAKDVLVSIIVRTKDRPGLLRRALMSVAAQTYRPVEVVLVNDGGCDLDIAEIKDILDDVSLNYIRLEKNMGRAHAGNVGIENAKGRYVGFLDDDDELFPEHVSVLESFLSKGSYKVAYTDSLMSYREYDADFRDFRLIKEELVFSQDFDADMLLFENYIPLMCLLFETGVLSISGGFAAELDLYEDWDFLVRIAREASFCHIPRITAYYIQWNPELQIAQGNQDISFLDMSYLKVLSRHWDQITIHQVQSYVHEAVAARMLLKDYRKECDPLVRGIDKLESELREKKSLVTDLQIDLRDRDVLIKAMTETLGWRLLDKYRLTRKKLFSFVPQQMKNQLVQGISVLRKQGLKAVLRKANKKLLFNKSIKQTMKPIRISELSVLTIGNPVIEDPLKAKVSVIIPTKNAGDEFDYTLRRIMQQEGIEDIELIIIDSGSQDSTLEISRRYTKNVFQIFPEEFHHGETRNIGAGKAGGEFLVFTVQDAIPVGTQWLYKLIHPILAGQASAVTVRQIPRSDADLFASWSIWGYNLYLGYDNDRFADDSLFKKFDDLDLKAKRTMAGLDNVCLGVKKEVFDRYRFTKSYGEDLDLGVRLIQDGHVLMFQSSNAVIHSHTKPSLYLFKRYYVDTISLLNTLGVSRRSLPKESILGAASYLYCSVKMAVAKMQHEKEYTTSPEMLVRSFVSSLKDGITVFDRSWMSLQGDPSLDEYFSRIVPEDRQDIIAEMFGALTGDIMSFADFIKNVEAIKDIEGDFMGGIYKFFSTSAGTYLGANSNDRIDSFFRGI